MPIPHKTITIRKALSRAVILITSLSILLSIIVSTVIDVSNQKKTLIKELNTLAGIISFNAYVHVVFLDEHRWDPAVLQWRRRWD